MSEKITLEKVLSAIWEEVVEFGMRSVPLKKKRFETIMIASGTCVSRTVINREWIHIRSASTISGERIFTPSESLVMVNVIALTQWMKESMLISRSRAQDAVKYINEKERESEYQCAHVHTYIHEVRDEHTSGTRDVREVTE